MKHPTSDCQEENGKEKTPFWNIFFLKAKKSTKKALIFEGYQKDRAKKIPGQFADVTVFCNKRTPRKRRFLKMSKLSVCESIFSHKKDIQLKNA